MSWGRRPRYCCTNHAGGCIYALSDSLFSESQYIAWKGLCKGADDKPGCGQILVPGKPDDRRLRSVGLFVLGVAVFASAGLGMRTYVFPPPLVGIVFTTDQSRIDESDGRVVLEIHRTSASEARATLRALFVDGSAKASVDYQPPSQFVVLEPGQSEARISIPILPDATLRRGERHFSVVLDNVVGQPRHTIVIAPKHVDVATQTQIEQMVLNASRIAADIAGLVVKAETMESLLGESRHRPKEFLEYRQQMRDSIDNLVRAREAYLQAIRNLQTQPPQQILATIDSLEGNLRQRGFRQQARVLPVLGRQYQELINGKSADMDRWVKELGQTIERVPAGNSHRPTV